MPLVFLSFHLFQCSLTITTITFYPKSMFAIIIPFFRYPFNFLFLQSHPLSIENPNTNHKSSSLSLYFANNGPFIYWIYTLTPLTYMVSCYVSIKYMKSISIQIQMANLLNYSFWFCVFCLS